MNTVDKALQTQLKNIQTKSGKSLDQLYAVIQKSGLIKHGEIRDMLKRDEGLGHGDANTLVHFYFKSQTEDAGESGGTDPDKVLGEIYSGPKQHLRPIHDKFMAAINEFGPFEIAPKKAYVSLRRKKQFAMIGPATKTRVEVGLNMKGEKGTTRLQELKPGGMCQYKVDVTDPAEIDSELLAWVRKAYDAAG